jgi:hypothetical protein
MVRLTGGAWFRPRPLPLAISRASTDTGSVERSVGRGSYLAISRVPTDTGSVERCFGRCSSFSYQSRAHRHRVGGALFRVEALGLAISRVPTDTGSVERRVGGALFRSMLKF